MKHDGLTAFEGTLKNRWRNYPSRQDGRYKHGLLFPEVSPSFTLKPGQSIFTIGSCFARNIEQILLEKGFSVPTAHFKAPYEEAPGQPNRVLNQYNPGTMLQCIAGTNGDQNGLYDVGDDRVQDCLLATGSRPVTRKRATERRKEINSLYQNELVDADVVFITLGLIECWYDNETCLFLNEAPPVKMLKQNNGRFSFIRLSVSECQNMLREILGIVTKGNRHGIVTVSPVPLQVTFSGGDPVMRNAYSKAVLRAACDEVIEEFSGIDYFPSYEIAVSGGLTALGDDNVHVRPIIIKHILDYMVSRYVTE